MNKLTTQSDPVEPVLRKFIQGSGLQLTVAVESRPYSVPDLLLRFSGPDTSYLTARNGELLRALEHLALQVRRLPPEQHHLVFADADNFTATRNRDLLQLAGRIGHQVNQTGLPHTFAPMSSHERRLLHLALSEAGLRTASTGEGSLRAVVVYPNQP